MLLFTVRMYGSILSILYVLPTAIENFPFFPLPILWDYSKVKNIVYINGIAGPEKNNFFKIYKLLNFR